MAAVTLVGHDMCGNVLLKHQFGRHTLVDFLAKHPTCCTVMEACFGAHWLAHKLAILGHRVHGIRDGRDNYMGEIGFDTTCGAVVVGKLRE